MVSLVLLNVKVALVHSVSGDILSIDLRKDLGCRVWGSLEKVPDEADHLA